MLFGVSGSGRCSSYNLTPVSRFRCRQRTSRTRRWLLPVTLPGAGDDAEFSTPSGGSPDPYPGLLELLPIEFNDSRSNPALVLHSGQ